jgi:zinc protease
MHQQRAAAIALVLCAGCAAAGIPDEPVFKDYAVRQTDYPLGSGLRVLVQENHTSPLLTITSVFDVGGTSDPPGREGLAHLVEHLVFRSVPEGGTSPVWDILQRSGATFNAWTSADLTTYYQTAHRDRLAELMELESWRLAHTLDGVTEEAFQIELKVVQNELRQRYETTIGSRSFDELQARMYPAGHPQRRSVAGTHESLASLTLEDARQFVATHYRPEKCTIVVAGDVQPAQVGKLVGRWPATVLFGPGGKDGPKVPHSLIAQRPPPPVPAPSSTALGRLQGPVSRPELWIAWSLPGGLRGNDAIVRFTASSLEISLRTRFRYEVDDDLDGFHVGLDSAAHGSMMYIRASVREGANPERVRTRLLDAVGGAWSAGYNWYLAHQGTWQEATTLLRTSGDPVADAEAVAVFLASTGGSDYYAASLRELARITAGDLSSFAHRYLNRERAVSVYFEPEQGGHASASRTGQGALPEHRLTFDDQVNLVGLGPEQILNIAHPPGLAHLPYFQLANGMKVLFLPRPGAPVAELHLQIPGGDATASPYGLASLATQMSQDCVPERGKDNLHMIGASLGTRHDSIASRFSVDVLAGNLKNGLATLADTVSCRHVSDSGFEWHSHWMKEADKRQRERDSHPQARARKTFWSALYPQHPYGWVEADYRSLGDLSHEDITNYVEGHFLPNGAMAVVAADAPRATIQQLVEGYFGTWVGGRRGGRRPPPPPARVGGRVIYLFDRPGATQSDLRLGCRIGPVTAERLPAFDVLEAVTSHQAWEMRESWGATYGIHGRVVEWPRTAHLLIEGAVETDRTGAAVEKLLGLIGTLATEGPDMKTFTLKRWDLARGFDLGMATPAAVARAVLRADLNGWPLDTWDRYPERLAATSRADVRGAIAPCAGHEVITVVGDAARVRPALEQAGLGQHLAPTP